MGEYSWFVMFVCGLANIPFIDWERNWWSPMSFGFCIGVNIFILLENLIN